LIAWVDISIILAQRGNGKKRWHEGKRSLLCQVDPKEYHEHQYSGTTLALLQHNSSQGMP
jgi:hypothetical protein